MEESWTQNKFKFKKKHLMKMKKKCAGANNKWAQYVTVFPTPYKEGAFRKVLMRYGDCTLLMRPLQVCIRLQLPWDTVERSAISVPSTSSTCSGSVLSSTICQCIPWWLVNHFKLLFFCSTLPFLRYLTIFFIMWNKCQNEIFLLGLALFVSKLFWCCVS